MKNFLLLTLTILVSFNLKAQNAPDFTATDIDNVTHHLYTELDAGNTVVLKFFTDWCPVCHNQANGFQMLWETYQTNGDNVVIWALDRDQNEDNADAMAFRDAHNLTFPVIGEAYPVAQLFGVVYQPEYYIICPDRSYLMKINVDQVDAAVQQCLASTGTGINEAVISSRLDVAGNNVTWSASSNESATLHMYDIQGREVKRLPLAGQERVVLNELLTGIYLYTLEQNSDVIISGKVGLVE